MPSLDVYKRQVKKQLESHTLKFAAPYTYKGSEKAELKDKTFDRCV